MTPNEPEPLTAEEIVTLSVILRRGLDAEGLPGKDIDALLMRLFDAARTAQPDLREALRAELGWALTYGPETWSRADLEGIQESVRRLLASQPAPAAVREPEGLDGPIPHTEGATTWDVPWIVSDTGPNAQQPRWLVHTAGAAVIADVESERHARWIVDRWNREYALASQPAVRDDLPPSNPSLMGDIQQEAER